MRCIFVRDYQQVLDECKFISENLSDDYFQITLLFKDKNVDDYDSYKFKNQIGNELFIWNNILLTFGKFLGYSDYYYLDLFEVVEQIHIRRIS